MKRRDFLLRAVPVSTVPFLLGGFEIRAYGRTPILERMLGTINESDHVLVLVQLNGGNDGLNTVIPLDQYPAIMNARPNIAIAEDKVLLLSGSTGLHPSMIGLQQLYSDSKLAVVQGVGYPNPNFSHFRATDIWLTAADSDQVLTSGWMGRYLDQEYPDYPNGYPNTVAPDPLAIQVGSIVSSGLQGPSVSLGMAVTSTTSFYQLVNGGVDTAPNTPAGHELTYIREVIQETQLYTASIKTAAGNAKNLSPLYPAPGQNPLADQLKIVAQLVAGGLKTRMYVVNLGGFDTHSAQIDSTAGTDVGKHAKLLGQLSTAILAFQDDLRLLSAEERVIGMTFSEFGRRIKANASYGTDHGTAAPMFLFGKRIFAGIYGPNPALPVSATVDDNLQMETDFRSVYASVLKEWFHVSDTELQAVLFRDFQTLPLVRPPTGGPRLPIVDGTLIPGQPGILQNYPNPFNPSTHIKFSSGGQTVQLKVFDALGREVRTLVDGSIPSGIHDVTFDATGLPSGMYFYRMSTGDYRQVRSMMLAR